MNRVPRPTVRLVAGLELVGPEELRVVGWVVLCLLGFLLGTGVAAVVGELIR